MSPHGGKRAGAGRPRTLDEPVTLSFQCDRSIGVALIEHCLRADVTLSEAVRVAVREYLERQPKPAAKKRKRAKA